jgi:hypothetical protein
MIRGLPSLILVTLVLGACGPVSRPETTRPSRPAASNACGGFHLLVINDDDYAVDIDINGGNAGSVEASSQQMLVRLFSPDLPPFPWVVELSRTSDGVWVGTAELDVGVGDTKITVSGGQINVSNFDLASTGCGLEGAPAAPPQGFGPLAVATIGNGDMARNEGVLVIMESCAFLRNADGSLTLLIWPAAQVEWDAGTREVTFARRDGLVQLGDGDRVELGGSGGGLGRAAPPAALLDYVPWVSPPMQECGAPDYWWMGEIGPLPEGTQ